jgi:alpha-beta hydrolase superfamily lysophospholipase
MELRDNDLTNFKRHRAEPLPATNDQGYVDHEGARIWYATFGAGHSVIMLHGGLGNSGNWGYQVPGLMSSGYRVVLIDSRGHGRSTRDEQPYTYELIASDVLAVMDHLQLEKAAFVAGATAHALLWSSPEMPPCGVQVSSSLPATWIPAA